MCGQFILHKVRERSVDHFGVEEFSETGISRHWNVAPSQDIWEVRTNAEGRREITRFRWGWPPIGQRNRASSQHDQRQGRDRREEARLPELLPPPALPHPGRRFLRVAAGEAKEATLVRLFQGRRPLRLRRAVDPVGGSRRDRRVLHHHRHRRERPPALIHDRMPAILAPGDSETWLAPSHFDQEKLEELLRPFRADKMEAYRMSTRVNAPKNNDADCVEPLDA